MSGRKIKNILIAAVQVPFTRGGAEVLVDSLRRELLARDFNAEIVQIPFNARYHEEIVRNSAVWRSLDFTEFNGKKIDLVIATKFPSYLLRHHRKVAWLVHQHRQMYELYGTRFGDFTTDIESEGARRMLMRADATALKECQRICTISANVTERLDRYLDIHSEVVHPPLPLGSRYVRGGVGDYILSVGRLCSIKRVDLIIKALPQIDERLKLKVVGVSDEPGIEEYYRSEIDHHHLWHRVEFLGRVSDEDLLGLYANAFATYYAPFDEDYGFVTLESLASGTPVVTASDSGGVLSFVQDGKNGLVAEPTERSLAEAFNRLYADSALYDTLVQNSTSGFSLTGWDHVVDRLTLGAFTQSAEYPEEVANVK